MSHVLLTHGYFLRDDEKELQIMKPYPPLGLLYVAAYLRERGVQVEVFDSTFAVPEDLRARLDGPPSVLGVYTNLMTRGTVVRIVREARARGWTVVLGGPESANYPDEYLGAGAHAVVFGEGEAAMADLLPALAARGTAALADVPGIAFLDAEGRTVRTPAREQIRDLDRLPWPARDLIDVDRYVDVWRDHHGAGSVNLITARGCPYRCRWCSHAVFGFTHRRRTVGNVADELAAILERYVPDQVWYADDVFTIHHRWLFNYADELDRRGLRVPFETISRADRLMDDRVLETLARMGCSRIWIGSESGSQRILDAMERGVTTEQVQWATHAAQRHGIEVGMFLMWGYDGETVEDIAATVDHVRAANPDVFFTTVAYPIKNTAFYDAVAHRVGLDRAWEDATDRDFTIRGQRDRDYYRLADRWLRGAVEADRIRGSDPERAASLDADASAARDALYAATESGVGG